MANLGTFNADEQDTSQRSTLELGNYRLEVTESDVTPTKNGNGTILKLTVTVIEPEEFKGRKIFVNMNIENANAVAEKIGKEDLAKLCRAVGLSTIEDSEELHFKPFTAKVGIESKPQAGYEPRNEIKTYYYPDEEETKPIPTPGLLAAPPAGKAAATPANDNRPAAAAAPAAKGANPWSKPKAA